MAVEVGNLPQDRLGVTIGGQILIDSDAAGHGWFDVEGSTEGPTERVVTLQGVLPPAPMWHDGAAVRRSPTGEAPAPAVKPVVEPSGDAAASSAGMLLGPAESGASHPRTPWAGPLVEVRSSLIDWTGQNDGHSNPYAHLAALSGPGPERLIDWMGRSGATTPVFDPGAGLIPNFGEPDAERRPAREAAAEREPAADDGAPGLVLLLEPADPGERRRGS